MRAKILLMVVVTALALAAWPLEVRAAGEDSGTEAVLSDAQYYETGLPGVTMQGTGLLYYKVVRQGFGQGIMEVSGNASGHYRVVVNIVKPGVIGEAEYCISLDGGVSFIGRDVVADKCRIADAGLTLYFSTEQDNMEFALGDTYSVEIPETFPVTASRYGKANIVAAGEPMADHEITVEILSSGGPGNAKFSVAIDQSKVADVIPEDGIYALEDDMQLIFSASEGYERGQVFSVSVKSNHRKTNYIPLIILAAVLAFAGIWGYIMLLNKREKPDDYKLHFYTGRKDRYE